MDEARLLSLLAEARRQEPAPQAGTVLTPHPGELTFARARALALDPGRWTDAERAHVAACPRCRRLADRCTRQMPHPSWWTLLNGQRNHLDPPTTAYLDQHLRDCRPCRERRAVAARLAPAVITLTLPSEVRSAASPDRRLQVDVLPDPDRFTLSIRTRDPFLTAFAARPLGERGVLGHSRYVTSRRRAHEFDAVIDGRAWLTDTPIRGIEIAPVDLRCLSSEDRTELLDSIRQADPGTRAEWHLCLEAIVASNPDLCPLLRAAAGAEFTFPPLAEPAPEQRTRRAGGSD